MLYMEFGITFRDFPEDVFQDGYVFESREEAAAWFNPQHKKWKTEGAKITNLKEWPDTPDIKTPYEGEFFKGYIVEFKDGITTWVLITKTT